MSFATESWLDCAYHIFAAALRQLLKSDTGVLLRVKEDDGFHSITFILPLIGEKPGVKRNYFQRAFEKISVFPGLFAYFIIRLKWAGPKKYGDNARLDRAAWENCKNARGLNVVTALSAATIKSGICTFSLVPTGNVNASGAVT